MAYLPNILFALALMLGIGYFVKHVKTLIRNIKLGRPLDLTDHKTQRWKNMIKIALGQRKMIVRPVSGLLHIIAYLGFIIINIEVVEIIIDGLFGTHRIFSSIGTAYYILIGSFEILALAVILAVTLFWIRRNILHIKRFHKPEMTRWPKKDANYILYFEIVLMTLFLIMNTTDRAFQEVNTGNFISQYIAPFFSEFSGSTLHILERSAWWLHILGILVFLNYLYFSKHLHILLAFPNTYYGKIAPHGQLDNMPAITQEVKLMLDPDADPYATTNTTEGSPEKFGASDIQELSWLQLMNAYTCTECGRCTSQCPANQTGKKLSPRRIMMATRDRTELVGKNIDQNNGTFVDDGERLLDDYISREEIWACTTCNACVEACPVSIDPLSIIIDLRRYLVMEQSAAPAELNTMMSNLENNGAPWAYNQMDRMNWTEE